MSRVRTGPRNLGYGTDQQAQVHLQDAAPEAVTEVLAADPNDEDGRSQWVWMRFPNGDLVLATFPQGDTYFSAWEETQ
jgi:hypothetical protein